MVLTPCRVAPPVVLLVRFFSLCSRFLPADPPPASRLQRTLTHRARSALLLCCFRLAPSHFPSLLAPSHFPSLPFPSLSAVCLVPSCLVLRHIFVGKHERKQTGAEVHRRTGHLAGEEGAAAPRRGKGQGQDSFHGLRHVRRPFVGSEVFTMPRSGRLCLFSFAPPRNTYQRKMIYFDVSWSNDVQ